MSHSSPNNMMQAALEPDIRVRWLDAAEVEKEAPAFAKFFMGAALETYGAYHPRDILALTLDGKLRMCAIYDAHAAVIEGVLWLQLLETPGGLIADVAFLAIQEGKLCAEPLWKGAWRSICETLTQLECDRVQVLGRKHLGVLLDLEPLAHQYATMLRKRDS